MKLTKHKTDADQDSSFRVSIAGRCDWPPHRTQGFLLKTERKYCIFTAAPDLLRVSADGKRNRRSDLLDQIDKAFSFNLSPLKIYKLWFQRNYIVMRFSWPCRRVKACSEDWSAKRTKTFVTGRLELSLLSITWNEHTVFLFSTQSLIFQPHKAVETTSHINHIVLILLHFLLSHSKLCP